MSRRKPAFSILDIVVFGDITTMQKVSFECEVCDARGTIRLPDDCDGLRIEVCPCCGSPLDLEEDDE